MFCYCENKKLKLTYFEVGALGGFSGGFLGGFTQKKPLGFFWYVPGCLNPVYSCSVCEDSVLEMIATS